MLLSFLLSFFIVHEGKGFRDVRNYSVENWTSCEQFLYNTTFNRDSVVDIDWKIFYFWNFEIERSYNIRFSYPTRTLVDRFRVELDEDLKPEVNWTNADLFMETSINFSGLLIKTNTPGKYKLISSMHFRIAALPQVIFAMKVVEPGYLGLLHCKYRLCYALAPVDKMPHDDNLISAAAKLHFWSPFGRSYLIKPQKAPVAQFEDTDDADDDEELEIRAKIQ